MPSVSPRRSRYTRVLSLLICALLVTTAVGSVPSGALRDAPGSRSASAVQAANVSDNSAMTLRVQLRPDGDARWRVTVRYALESANETRAFDRLATEFQANETPVLSPSLFRRAARIASRSTGREMRIVRTTRDAGRNNSTGRLVLAFTWTNFTRTQADRLELGDVFRSGDGNEAATWLPRLTARQTLIIEFPAGYAARSASERVTNGTIRLEGPTTFEPGQPSVVLVPAADETTDRTPEPPASIGVGLAGGVLVVVLLAGGYVLVRRRRRVPEPSPATEADPGDGNGGEPTATDPATEADTDSEPSEPEPTDAEPLLSDEERVLRLLHANDGRMKQSRIVEETGWSNAKVSQLLSEMDENGDIEKLRIGRENLISLPGESPDGAE